MLSKSPLFLLLCSVAANVNGMSSFNEAVAKFQKNTPPTQQELRGGGDQINIPSNASFGRHEDETGLVGYKATVITAIGGVLEFVAFKESSQYDCTTYIAAATPNYRRVPLQPFIDDEKSNVEECRNLFYTLKHFYEAATDSLKVKK